MIVQNKTEQDVIETSNMNDSITGTISLQDMGKILEMVSKNAYAYPIPSILREITSNGFDAHVKANTFENVVINIVENEDEIYIEFIDKGIGMNPETIKNVYMKWGNSQSSGSNDFIGGWGLGSKSCFSYTEFFEIITISEGTKYHYYFHNQNRDAYGNREFTLDPISDVPTEERNGTTIKIPIEKIDDLGVFLDSIRPQLSYFNNLTININIVNQNLSRLCVINQGLNTFNYEKIIEYKTFKYRIPYGDSLYNSSSYNVRKKDKEQGLFIIIDSVKYPIDYKNVSNRIEQYKSSIYAGLKFDIGELEVTINREAINYTEKTKSKIEERFDEFLEELKQLYISQHNQSENNYNQYLLTERKSLKLGTNDYSFSFDLDKYFFSSFQLYKTYSYLSDLKLFKADFSCLRILYNSLGYVLDDTLITNNESSKFYYLRELVRRSGSYKESFNQIKISNNVLLVDKKTELVKVKNFYLEHGSLIFQKLNYENKKEEFIEYCKQNNVPFVAKLKKGRFGTQYELTDYTLEELVDESVGSIIKSASFYVKLNNDLLNPHLYDTKKETLIHKGKKYKYNVRIVPTLGKAIELIKMIKHFKTFFDSIANYSDIIITDEMQSDYTEYVREKNPQYKRRKEEKIVITENCSKIEVSVDYILNKAENIIVMIKRNNYNKEALSKYNDVDFINQVIEYNVKNKNNPDYSLLQISETGYKSLQKAIKMRLLTKKISRNPLMSIDDFYKLKRVKRFLMRCTFGHKAINLRESTLFDSEQNLISNVNKHLSNLKITLQTDYLLYLRKMYFDDSYSKKIKSLLQNCFNYFYFSEEEYKTILVIDNFITNMNYYDESIANIVKKNPILKYLNAYTPHCIIRSQIKGVKKMNHFYVKSKWEVDLTKVQSVSELILF